MIRLEPGFRSAMDLYKVLGLQGGLDGGAYASSAQIRSAYKSQSLRCHPDKRPNDPVQAAEEFQTLQEAYQVLSDENKRKNYDNELYSSLLKGPIQPPQKRRKKKTGNGINLLRSNTKGTSSNVGISLDDVKKIKETYGVTGVASERTVYVKWNCSSFYDEEKLGDVFGMFGPIERIAAPKRCKEGTGIVIFKFRASAAGAVSGLKNDPELKLQMGA